MKCHQSDIRICEMNFLMFLLYRCFCVQEELHFHQTMNFTKPDEEDGVGGRFACLIHAMSRSFIRLQICRMQNKINIKCMLIRKGDEVFIETLTKLLDKGLAPQ